MAGDNYHLRGFAVPLSRTTCHTPAAKLPLPTVAGSLAPPALLSALKPAVTSPNLARMFTLATSYLVYFSYSLHKRIGLGWQNHYLYFTLISGCQAAGCICLIHLSFDRIKCSTVFRCQDDTAQPAQTPVSYLSKLMSNIKLMEVKQPSGCRLSSSTGSTILVHRPPDWYFRIYIRVDLSGRFHTYPHTGGPFQSLQETQSAIDRHLHDLEHPTM